MRCHCPYIVVFASVVIALLTASTATGQQIIYVNQVASGAHDGTSWTDAFVHVQDALAVSTSGDEVWVHHGIYHPDLCARIQPGDRDTSFVVGQDDARGEIRLVVDGECRYPVAGSQMIASVTERGDRQRAYIPTPGLMCLN